MYRPTNTTRPIAVRRASWRRPRTNRYNTWPNVASTAKKLTRKTKSNAVTGETFLAFHDLSNVFVIQSPFYGYDLDASFLKALPRGRDAWVQAFFLDQTAVQGVVATNGFKVRNP